MQTQKNAKKLVGMELFKELSDEECARVQGGGAVVNVSDPARAVEKAVENGLILDRLILGLTH